MKSNPRFTQPSLTPEIEFQEGPTTPKMPNVFSTTFVLRKSTDFTPQTRTHQLIVDTNHEKKEIPHPPSEQIPNPGLKPT